jgi:hypothetical protein
MDMNRHRVAPVAIAALALSLGSGCDVNVNGPTIVADGGGSGRLYSESRTLTYDVADSSSVNVSTFTGLIEVEQAPEAIIGVTVTMRADLEEDLAGLAADAELQGNVLTLAATNPLDLKDVSVDFELHGPPDMNVDAHSGVGTIICRGTPPELWNVSVGVGNIELVIPADANVRVSLVTGVGSVAVGIPVQGTTSSGSVVGNIGTGADGEIVARCDVGNIVLTAFGPARTTWKP